MSEPTLDPDDLRSIADNMEYADEARVVRACADEIELLRDIIRDITSIRVIEGNVVEDACSLEAIASADHAAAARRALAVPDEYLDEAP